VFSRLFLFLMLIRDEKYLLNASAISFGLVRRLPSVLSFRVLLVERCLPNRSFIIFHVVLTLLFDFRILLLLR